MNSKINYNKFLKKKSCAIYLFHGVVDRKNIGVKNYTNKHIHINKFKKILKNLKNKGQAISMDDIVNLKKNKIDFPDYSYAITFDDGYYNNYSFAAPILNDLNVPATFYVTTDFIANNSMSWIDMIEDSISKLKFRQKIFYKNFKSKNLISKKNKIRFLNFLRKEIKTDNKIDPYKEVRNIAKNNNIILKTSLNNIFDKKMTWDNLNKISSDKKFIVGGHGKTHRILSYLNNDDVKNEIKNSINLINKKLSIKVKHFSYPEGLNFCFGKREISILKKNGIKCSPSAVDGINKIKEDLFNLKRIFCN